MASTFDREYWIAIPERTMTNHWDKLPSRFLKMSFRSWTRLDRDIQRLVCDLADRQEFKCALCSQSRGLVIDHDHGPEEGTGNTYTKYNVRGLVCGSCNWHLGFYECEINGGYFGWENASCRISDSEYEDYIYAYKCRVQPLVETLQEQIMGSANYWRRRRHHERFDEWYYEGARVAWRERLVEEKARTIDTPEQFFHVFTACTKFVAEQIKRDPDFRPPQKFVEVFFRVRSLVEYARTIDNELATEVVPVATNGA